MGSLLGMLGRTCCLSDDREVKGDFWISVFFYFFFFFFFFFFLGHT